MIRKYLNEIIDIAKSGDSTELSYYSSLENLIKEYAKTKNLEITVITIPKKTEVGYPDFKILSGVSKFIGCIEAKSTIYENLDSIVGTEQLKKYKTTFPNLILTNFYEFRLYRNGTQICKTQITFPPLDIQTPAALRKEKEFCNLLDRFLDFSIPKITTSEKLAEELAKRTKFLKEDIMKVDEIKNNNNIKGFYNAFKEYLVPDLDNEQFADLLSQTITYSLFASRTRIKDRESDKFSRKVAYENIPHRTLRDIFRYISQEKIPEQLSCIIDDITEVLATTPVNRIFIRTQLSLGKEFVQEESEKDPIYHFYEPFLAKYNPKERERRGVYYTPLPVVSYIVRSLNILLKEKFNKSSGFADKGVTVLDPAAGTLTFLIEAIKLAVNESIDTQGKGSDSGFVKDHILKNFYAFELMMAPYAVGHLKMLFVLKELGYDLKDDGVRFYLTNTLEPGVRESTTIPGIGRTLSEEAGKANEVKKATPILVILSNPPYSGISANMTDWIMNLIKDYKYVDGKPLKERKQWLQDDYVKFIRWAQWKIEQLGEGCIGFITNHSYLDNPTFRGMRQSLMNSFNEIYTLNLHGSVRKGGTPDNSKDENVFNIQQGVAISLFIKNKSQEKCKVYYYDVWGKREDKYTWLNNNDKNTTNWVELEPHSPWYFFVPKKEKYLKEYQKYPSIKDIFLVNSVGVVTSRDNFVIDFDKEALKNRIMMFRNPSKSDEEIRFTYKLKDTSTFNLKEAREELSKDKNWDKYFTQILYRPFDKRWIYYNKNVIERPLLKVMQHMRKENLGIITVRQSRSTGSFCHAMVSDIIIEACAISNRGSEINYLFPLWLYPEDIFNNGQTEEQRRANMDSKITDRLNKSYKKKLLPEQIFYYIYGILYSNTYRKKHDEFLKYDFPRIPFTNDYSAFNKISKLGKKLVDLHLLRPEEVLDPPIVRFWGEGGDCRVEKVEFRDNRVEINKIKYFDKVLKNMWEYQIGGYQVLEKWLKERKDRILSYDELCNYNGCGTAIARTIQIQKEIDKIYPKAEKGIIDF